MRTPKLLLISIIVVLTLIPVRGGIAAPDVVETPLEISSPDGDENRALTTETLVAFRPDLGGVSAYTPGVSQTLCFQSRTETDGITTPIASRWLKFPTGWNVSAVTKSSQYCENVSSSWGSFSWAYDPLIIGTSNGIRLDHPLTQMPSSLCTVTYCVTVTPAASTNPAPVSWFFDGGICSSDGYAPSGYTCNVFVQPPASIPAQTVDKYVNWSTSGSIFSSGRRGAAAVAFGDTLYLFGGEVEGGGRAGAVQVLNPVTQTWSNKAGEAMKTPAAFTCAAPLGDLIYVVGGLDVSNNYLNKVQVYNPSTGLWSDLATPLPEARAGVGCAAVGGNLYVFGGQSATGYRKTGYVFNGSGWTAIAPMTNNRGYFGSTVIDGKIYAVGGVKATGTGQSTAEVFNPTAGTWQSLPNIGTPRAFHGAFNIGDDLIICGGAYPQPPFSYYNSCELYNTSLGTTGHWRYLAQPMVTGLGDFAYAALGVDLYIISGYDGSYSTAVYRMQNDHPPYFTSTPITSVKAGETYRYEITADDPYVGDTLTFSATTKPSWLTLTDHGDRTATLEGMPTSANIGDHNVNLMVTDNNDLQKGNAFQSFKITVYEKQPPVFTSTPVTSAVKGAPYRYTITTDDPNLIHGDTLEIKPWILLPAWLTFTDHGNTTATLEGTPGSGDLGEHEIQLRVKDSDGLDATQSFTLTVHANQAPTFTTDPVTVATQGIRYLYLAETTDPNLVHGDKLKITAPKLPAWIDSVSYEGTAGLSGTPTLADVGEHEVELVVTDSGGLSATQKFTITVTEQPTEPLPAPFSKTTPANSAIDLFTSLTLTWGTSTEATSFEICYDTSDDNACSDWVLVGLTTSQLLSGLTPDTTYYWHVRANNSAGSTYSNGSATAFWSFRTGAGGEGLQIFLPLLLK